MPEVTACDERKSSAGFPQPRCSLRQRCSTGKERGRIPRRVRPLNFGPVCSEEDAMGSPGVTRGRRRSITGPAFMLQLARLAIVLVLVSPSMAAAAEKQGFVVLPNTAPSFLGPVGGEANTAEMLATREQTGGTLGVWRYTSTIPWGPALQIHRAEDEFFYVLSGEFNFQLGECVKRAPAGSFVFIPKDVAHTFQHLGPDPGVLLGTVHPGGFEGLFQGLPRADEATVRALFKKHAMEVVGPPLEG